jgi:Uncharacterized protein conserved in bacteria
VLTRRFLPLGAGAVLLASASPGLAQADAAACDAFPDRPITLVAAAGPGSSMDITSRQIAEPLSQIAGVTVNVVNQAGAAGSVGYNYLRSQPHDGYTIMTMNRTLTLAPYTSGSDFDPEMLQGIARSVSDWEVLIVDADSPWQTAQDFVADARAASQPTVFSGPSVGSVANITAFQFARVAGFEFSYVPSPSGGEALLGVMGGQIPAAFSEPSETWGQMQANEIRYLGVASPERLEIMPDVPTLKEQGYDLEANSWRGFVVPVETPDCIVEKLDAFFNEAIHSESYVNAVNNDRSAINYLDAAAFDEELRRADAEAAQIARDLGIL